MAELNHVSTSMSTVAVLDAHENGEAIDQREYRSMIGSLLYLTVTKSDIQFVVCLCARFQASSRFSHQTTIQRNDILVHLRLILLGFPMLILWVVGLNERELLVLAIFSDLLLYVGQLASIFCYTVHHRGRVCSSCSQILWIVQTMRDYVVTYKSVPLMYDSSSAICLAHTLVFYGRAKHINVRHHFLRDHVEKGDIKMKFIDTERQLADIFTKPLDSSQFVCLRGKISVCHPYGLF
jgi:hypothetical protein